MKKVTGILLALVLAFAFLPITVWAGDADVAKTNDGGTYATLEEAVAKVEKGGTVTLLKSCEGKGCH